MREILRDEEIEIEASRCRFLRGRAVRYINAKPVWYRHVTGIEAMPIQFGWGRYCFNLVPEKPLWILARAVILSKGLLATHPPSISRMYFQSEPSNRVPTVDLLDRLNYICLCLFL